MTTMPEQPGPDAPTGAAGAVNRVRKAMEPLLLVAILVGWIVLQVWVLPKLGIRT
jgi:hypothetical protein